MRLISERTQLGVMKRRCGDLGRKKGTITARKQRDKLGILDAVSSVNILREEGPEGPNSKTPKSKSVTSHHRVSTCFGLECSLYAAAPCCHGHRCFCLRCPPRLHLLSFVFSTLTFVLFRCCWKFLPCSSRFCCFLCERLRVISLLEHCTAEGTYCAFYDAVIIIIAFIHSCVKQERYKVVKKNEFMTH